MISRLHMREQRNSQENRNYDVGQETEGRKKQRTVVLRYQEASRARGERPGGRSERSGSTKTPGVETSAYRSRTQADGERREKGKEEVVARSSLPPSSRGRCSRGSLGWSTPDRIESSFGGLLRDRRRRLFYFLDLVHALRPKLGVVSRLDLFDDSIRMEGSKFDI
ncbi:hypothetical protein BHE74_00012115 [Ensete ventricosum]|nr:hypothetical protein GW17_00033665 [Ensete ventricosum]RWW79592.1 hypothetical protein BHE74_00012115 [Ensete ventricosum]RZR84036.1 hypothetical protein BHM03_00010766 [Ensete ventricosum]